MSAEPDKPSIETRNETNRLSTGKKKAEETLPFKAPLINPAWTEEAAAHFGLSGPLAKSAAAALSSQLAAAMIKKWTRTKLARLVRIAVAEAIK